MDYEITCSCGKVVRAGEVAADSSIACICGRTVHVPALDEVRPPGVVDAAPGSASDPEESGEPSPQSAPTSATISPAQIVLRMDGVAQVRRRVPVMSALTGDALWIQDTWQTRQIPLDRFRVESRKQGKELVLTLGSESTVETLTLDFSSAVEGDRWLRDVQEAQQRFGDAPEVNRYVPEGVALVRKGQDLPYAFVSQIVSSGPSPWAASRALQLQAAVRGADAIIQFSLERRPEGGRNACRVYGTAVRVEDGEARKRFRVRWFTEEVGLLVRRILPLLVIYAGLVFLLITFAPGLSGLNAPTGESPSEALLSGVVSLTIVYAWPLVMLGLLRGLCWPQLLRIVGLAVLAVTTLRGLTVDAIHLLVIYATGTPLAAGKIWLLVDPIEWALIIVGGVVCFRAWRLAGDARQILPPEAQMASTARKVWSRILLATTGVYALGLLGFVGVVRFEQSSYVLQPGVDPRREQEALLALNEGSKHANENRVDEAERCFRRALPLWEKLAEKPSVPLSYRTNLMCVLNNLGWAREQQGRDEEAEQYYVQAMAAGEAATEDSRTDDDFAHTLAYARDALAKLRENKSCKVLEVKDQTACRKYEEATVKAENGDVAAEELCREAITLWEEILPQATDEGYRRCALSRLESACLVLAEMEQRSGKRSEAEAAAAKAIRYGEKAVALEPDRPLPKHNLEVARRTLDELREQALQDEIDSLCKKQRFADAVALWKQGIQDQEEQVRTGKDREAAVSRLAHRLDRFAWFLAHCPDDHVRDTKAAVQQATRATEFQPARGDYWFTRAMVEYRNGDWRSSLASLEKSKATQGILEASYWLLVAMNRHQLKQREPAREALREAVKWIKDQQLKAQGDPLLRFQYELMRSSLEALWSEAEKLIGGEGLADWRTRPVAVIAGYALSFENWQPCCG